MKFIFLVIFMAIFVTGCGSSSPALLKTHVESVSFLNPNIYNQPSPVVITIYQLKSATAFQQTNFFALYSNPTATLSSDLLDKHEIEIRPNQKLDIKQTISPDANYIGILAAFRNPDAAQWRQIIPVTPGSNVKLKINLSAQNLSAKVN
jgi:type VI secretion system protein VasD